MTQLIRDIPIYYEEYGKGKPVLCIHGYWVDHRLMSGCLESVFAEIQGYRRIYLDLPGMGKTPSAKWIRNSDNMLEILTEFIDAVIPGENYLVAGESYGGYLTLGLIHNMRNRIDGVLMICPQLKSWVAIDREKLPEKQLLWKSEDIMPMEDEPEFQAFLEYAVIATPVIYDRYKTNILSGIAISDKDFLTNHFSSDYNSGIADDLERLEFDRPACILTGRQDHAAGYLDAFEILSRFPRATFAVLDCAGHNLQDDNEPLFDQHVKDWLWRVGMK